MSTILPRTTYTQQPDGYARIASRRRSTSAVTLCVLHYGAFGNVTWSNPTLAQTVQRLLNVRSWHINGNRWADIGYDYAVDQAGRIIRLRSPHYAGAGAIGHNFTAIHVLCLVGNGERLSPAARRAIRSLGRSLRKTFTRIAVRPRGHGELPQNATACPGRPIQTDINAGTLNFTASTPTAAPAPSAPASSPAATSSANTVSGRFLRCTANTRANLRAQPSVNSTQVGTVQRGHLLKRDRSRDTAQWFGVGDNWFISKTVAAAVSAAADSELAVGSWPGNTLAINGVNTFEMNRAWQELLARNGVDRGNRTLMWQRWLQAGGYNPGPLDGIEGPLTIRALQRRLNDATPRPRGVQPLVVDGSRGDLTRAMEKRFLNRQIDHIRAARASMYPQHYRFTQ